MGGDRDSSGQVREVALHECGARPDGFQIERVVYGTDPMNMGLNVVIARDERAGRPTATRLRALQAWRVGKTNLPVVVAVLARDREWWLQGPDSTAPPVGPLPGGPVERMLSEALREPSGAAARSRIVELLESQSRQGPSGMANAGLFATHYLTRVLPGTPDWGPATERAQRSLALRGRHLIESLGYRIRDEGATALFLMARKASAGRAIAVLLNDRENFDGKSTRFRVSPVAHGLMLAQRYELPWLIAMRRSQLRLYAARPGVGVGSRGQTDTYFGLDLAAIAEDDAGYLDLVFSADALGPDGGVERIIEESKRYTQGLGDRLRKRIYEEAIPSLAVAVANEMRAEDLAGSYRVTLLILFRLLFQAYAEDQGLLPSGRNEFYDRRSLKQRALDLVSGIEFDPHSDVLWAELRAVWRAIDTGNRRWDVPPYNGGLFGRDPEFNPTGAAIESIRLNDDIVGHALRRLLVDVSEDGVPGPVDFREMSIREFGTIYEGLIECTLSRAESNLALDRDAGYVPANDTDDVVVKAGEPYFHDTTGTRKATGTYFTPDFAVRHLLRKALDPALDDHLKRVASFVNEGDQAAAGEAFFDFRIADIAMGSGHFLIAAIDHIESKMTAFLAHTPVPTVTEELRRLQRVAEDAVGDSAADSLVDTSALLRRQIARRCVYGVDQSPIGVDLARVAVWLHTFVPGLPMSSLDHNLAYGNSLTGIGRSDEAVEILDPSSGKNQLSLFSRPIHGALELAKRRLVDAARAAEADKAEVLRSVQQLKQAREDAEPARLLFDAAIAARLSAISVDDRSVADIQRLARTPEVTAIIDELNPVHFPYLFPEVFLRENAGFDVVVGNPPWEKVKVEKQQWWGKYLPGIRSMSVEKMNAAIRQLQTQRADLDQDYQDAIESTKRLAACLKASYSRLGSGDTDLFKAFAWRFWSLTRSSGYVSVVMPRSALSGAGLERWRDTILDGGTVDEVTMLINTGQWIFEAVHGQYAVALLTARKGTEYSGTLRLRGPFHSLKEYERGTVGLAVAVSTEEFKSWSSNASFPSLPTPESLGIFRKMHEHPLFGDPPRTNTEYANAASTAPRSGTPRHPRQASLHSRWRRFRPLRELDAANDKHRFILDAGVGAVTASTRWPVYKGASFNIWEPDTGVWYASVVAAEITEHLQEKRLRQSRLERSAFYGVPTEIIEDPATLPCRSPRIAFRDVTRANDTRSVRCALIPPRRVLTHQAPYLVSCGEHTDEAFLLGVMSSIPFDWCARRMVELHLTFNVLNSLPVPRPAESSRLRKRVVNLAGRLAAHDDRFTDWAVKVGVPVGSLRKEPERSDAIAELDALVGLLYGLTERELVHVFETFHRGWDYEARLEAVLRHYRAWEPQA